MCTWLKKSEYDDDPVGNIYLAEYNGDFYVLVRVLCTDGDIAFMYERRLLACSCRV